MNRHRVIALDLARDIQIGTKSAAAVVAMAPEVRSAAAVAVSQRVKGATAEEKRGGESRKEDLFHGESDVSLSAARFLPHRCDVKVRFPRDGGPASRFDTPGVLA